MISCDIRTTKGPSLFADEPCVYLTLRLNGSEKELLLEHEQQAVGVFDALPLRLDAATLKESFDSAGSPFLVYAIAGLASFFLKKLKAFEGGPWVTHDPEGSFYHIAFPDFNPKTTVSALRLASQVAAFVYPKELLGIFPRSFQHAKPIAAWGRFLEMGQKSKKHRTTREIQKYLIKRSIPWFHLDRYSHSKDLIQIGYGRYQYLLGETTSFESSQIGISYSMSKSNTQKFLADLGFPVTKQIMAASADTAVFAAESLGYPVVLKPEYGAFGNNVHVNLRDEQEVRQAFNSIVENLRRNGRNSTNPIVVEEYVVGQDYRLTMAGGKLLVSYLRTPAQVIADGVNTVLELVELENKDPLRGGDVSNEATYKRIQLGEFELATLEKQGLSLTSVPPAGQLVLLRGNANWSSGGRLEDVTEITHPDNAALAGRIAKSMKIDLMGVDVIVNDIRESFLDGGLRVIEVNHSPGMLFSMLSESGNMIDRGGPLIELLAPNAIHKQVPVIVVSENSISNDLTESIAKTLSLEGFIPGLVNEAGMFVGGEPWANPEALDYSDPALLVLRNTEIDAAVIERRLTELVDHGVGTGACDVAVVLSIPDDDIRTEVWSDGIAPARAVEMLMQAARMASVVCVDDPALASCAQHIDASRLCVLSVAGETEVIGQLVSSGARAVVLETFDQDGIHLRVINCEEGGGAESKRVELPVSVSDAESALEIMALIGVLLCLDYSLKSSLKHFDLG